MLCYVEESENIESVIGTLKELMYAVIYSR